MKSLLTAICLMTFSVCISPALAEQPRIVVATDVWLPNYTVEGGTGLYEDIVRAVYPQHEIEFIYRDYLRTKALVRRGQADLWLGAYMNEEEYALYPNSPMDFDEVVSLQFIGPNSGQNARFDIEVIWLEGYQYDQYFTELADSYAEVTEVKAAVWLLMAGKAKTLLGDETELKVELHAIGYDISDFELKRFGDLGLYPAFAKTPSAGALIAQWDKRLGEMKMNGELLSLYQKHGLGEYYLFE
ncbi:hypothetical protein DRW07_06740 [Alteromonas sediminis]|uniref:ABC transporter substrate-binding protein n=1 Tax=Alteromonas sediminis TaxID=2259342 RepID=A0A3N5YCW8_9ALTE|nr:hypothetical protein [Alteromonas sediminis]RPJ67225.1 hypothetical protein DRW07_06740 [Alteromonas sediminis]